jgi:hypothetical protein
MISEEEKVSLEKGIGIENNLISHSQEVLKQLSMKADITNEQIIREKREILDNINLTETEMIEKLQNVNSKINDLRKVIDDLERNSEAKSQEDYVKIIEELNTISLSQVTN